MKVFTKITYLNLEEPRLSSSLIAFKNLSFEIVHNTLGTLFFGRTDRQTHLPTKKVNYKSYGKTRRRHYLRCAAMDLRV